MSLASNTKNSQNKLFVLYIVGFLLALQAALPAYVTSTFLGKFATEHFVGLLFTLASLLSIVAFSLAPLLLEKIGNYRTIFIFLVVEIISLLGLAFGNSLEVVAVSFIVNFILISLVGFNIDIFLEEYCPGKTTGKIRGFFLTIVSSAWVLATLLGGQILKDSDYSKVFLAGALLIIPVLGMIVGSFKKFEDPHYHKISLFRSFINIWRNKNILDVFMMNFLLHFFFAWMVIYTPMYLHNHIGFGWDKIGIIFGIMLIPFALLEFPLGKLADQKFGEKEMLAIGFIVMAISTAFIFFIPGANFFIWTLVLFMTRVGAAMVEVMCETYFFKKVPDTSLHIISSFRTMRPIAYVISPIIATVLLSFFEIQYLFIILGLLMFYGVRFALAIKDTR